MGDSSQKNFYEVIRALESGRTYKRPKVQAGVTIEKVSQLQPQPIALPATIATHEAVRAGLNAEVVETFAARDEAFPIVVDMVKLECSNHELRLIPPDRPPIRHVQRA